MKAGMQSVFINVPVGGDPSTFAATRIMSGAVGSEVDLSVSNFFGLNSASALYALDSNNLLRFARLLGVLDTTADQATQPNANNLILATMARLQGFDGTNFKRLLVSGGGWLTPPANNAVSVTAAANTALTLTIPAAGAGLFHYVTSIEIYRTATAALAGTATLVITSTNLNGMAWSVGNAMAAGGTQIDVSRQDDFPIKSAVANTNSTIVMPAPGAAVLWRAQVNYYTGA